MGKNTSVELGEEIAGFVSGQVQSDRYRSASEVIRAGIRLLQDQETKMAALLAALKKGEDSGAGVSFDVDQLIAARKAFKFGFLATISPRSYQNGASASTDFCLPEIHRVAVSRVRKARPTSQYSGNCRKYNANIRKLLRIALVAI